MLKLVLKNWNSLLKILYSDIRSNILCEGEISAKLKIINCLYYFKGNGYETVIKCEIDFNNTRAPIAYRKHAYNSPNKKKITKFESYSTDQKR